MKQINGIAFMVCIALLTQARAESLEDKIGEVAAYLYKTTIADDKAAITNVSGATRAIRASSSWNAGILGESKSQTNNAVYFFRAHNGSNTYDAVRTVFSSDGKVFETKQTIGVMTVSVMNQNTKGVSNEDLVLLVNKLARDYLSGVTNQTFSYVESIDGVKLLSMSVGHGIKCVDWRDLIWAIVDEEKVVFSVVKRFEDQQLTNDDIPMYNIRWFDHSGSKKRKR